MPSSPVGEDWFPIITHPDTSHLCTYASDCPWSLVGDSPAEVEVLGSQLINQDLRTSQRNGVEAKVGYLQAFHYMSRPAIPSIL